ncbi:helix-turn-helix domain-containing protein [Roseomonas sp. AR75]|uniref:helix-turn-helix transcriptional regulator n=1 Tax=Roseomonas sp. AR75 TaxID=2562311 RepID=UPI0010C00968|nr:helix-turn-helix domain-containing protein [Roseomonas sp. AR75]
MNDRPIQHINQAQLARRWSLSPRTLERWRWQDQGPAYLKVGGRVLYRLEDVEAFERAAARQPDALRREARA